MEQILPQTEILMLLKYFSIFRHPLTFDELYKFSSENETIESLSFCLNDMEQQGIVRNVNGFYLYNGDESYIKIMDSGVIKMKGQLDASELTGLQIQAVFA